MDESTVLNDQASLLAASFVPLTLRQRPGRNGPPVSGDAQGGFAAILWIDICAFTPLSNRLLLKGSKGVEQLSRILHEHYEPVLHTVNAAGGIPLLFAGDSLLSAWHCTGDGKEEAVQQAINCARAILALQKVPDDTGNPISLHIIVAFGELAIVELSDADDRRTYTVLGKVLSDLRQTTKTRAPGSILLSEAVTSLLADQLVIKKLNRHAASLQETAFPAHHYQPVPAKIISWPLKEFESFLPRPLQFRMDVEHLEWMDELRPVTIVFMQISGFADDAEDAEGKLKQLAESLRPVISKWEGILNQVWVDEKGTNFLIFFGPPPAAHIDNPVRGLHTAMELRSVLAKTGFAGTIGVSTGQAFCGILGNNLLRQYTVIGDVVNVGARLAESGTGGVLCDSNTMKSSTRLYQFNDPRVLSIKGKDEPVPVWEPVRLIPAAERRQALPLVGRQYEMKVLADGLGNAMRGEKAGYVLEGEIGIGKSRILSELRKDHIPSSTLVLAGSGDRIVQAIPYQSWRKIYSSLLQAEDLPDHTARQAAILDVLGSGYEEEACLLNVVLQLDFPDSAYVRNLSSSQRAVATHDLLIRLIRRASSLQPVVILIDDAQWMDEPSWKLAADILSSVERCFIICCIQAAKHPVKYNMILEAGASHLFIGALSEEEQRRLVCAALQVEQVAEDVLVLICGLAKGNPFFCIELVQALLAENIIIVQDNSCLLVHDMGKDSVLLPQTVQDAVRSRLGNLHSGADLALKVASVVGEEFPTDSVRTVYPIIPEQERVQEYLTEDELAGLIHPEIVDNMDGYTFNNSIIREVAYDTMLFEHRQRLHHTIAHWYEKTFAGNLSAVFSRLAYHCQQAGDHERAASYLEQESVRLFSHGFARQSVDIGLHGVEMLGLPLERDPERTGIKIGENIQAIMKLMANRPPSLLVDLKQSDDQGIEKLIWLMLRIGPFAFQSQQLELFTLLSLTCLRMTLEHGNSAASADVYSMYSVIHRELTGDRVAGHAWSQLALDVDAKNGSPLFCRIAFVHTWFHSHWVQPLQKSLPLALAAAHAGMNAGDILFACFNLSAYVVYQASLGSPLDQVINTAADHLRINDGRVANAAFHLVLEMQMAKALKGKTVSPLELTDEEYEEERDLAYICNTDFGNQIGYYLVAKIRLCVHFGHWQEACNRIGQVKAVLPAIKGQMAEIDLVVFQGLAALMGMAETHDSSIWLPDATEALHTVQDWAKRSPDNFLHKALLLQAFIEGLSGNEKKAELLFEQAAGKAAAGNNFQDLTLVHECHALVQRYHGKPVTALESALQACSAWGAGAKSAYLLTKYG